VAAAALESQVRRLLFLTVVVCFATRRISSISDVSADKRIVTRVLNKTRTYGRLALKVFSRRTVRSSLQITPNCATVPILDLRSTNEYFVDVETDH
jgi:hypothetical protein